MSLPIPSIGDWYRAPGGVLFEVIAVNEDDSTIDIQHFDGTVEELEFGAWEEAEYESADPPEDYSGSLDIEREDYNMDLDRGTGQERTDPLEYLDRSE
ncbi:MAG: hypothetical protein PVI87_04750 [Gammaproteobacteria bacterium]|jgi:hypothetical protein